LKPKLMADGTRVWSLIRMLSLAFRYHVKSLYHYVVRGLAVLLLLQGCSRNLIRALSRALGYPVKNF